MTFRQFGGLKYNTKHNAVSSNFNTSNNLVIREDAGISNNLKVTNDLLVQGNTDICGNLTAYNMFLSSGNNYSTQSNSVVPKSYVDTIATGLQILKPVTCISTYDNSGNTYVYPVPIYPVNVTSYYTNGFVINGYPVQLGESVLLNDQGNYADNKGEDVNNGVYDLSFNGNDYYFIRSSTELSLGSNAKGAYIKTIGGNINGGSGWVQVRSPAIVGINPLLFYAFNPSTSSGYTPGVGLYTSQQGSITYLNVDSSLNFLTGIDAPGGETLHVGTDSSILNLGSIDTSVNIAGNPYVYTPYSLGSTFSPQLINISTSSNTTQITFTWTIPQLYKNISSSFQNINATLYANISGNIKSYQILNNISSNINTLNNIIVTNQSSTSGFIDSNTSYNYYNQEFINMQDSSNNKLILWYSNYSPYPNVSYAGYSKFNNINPPSFVLFNYGETPTLNTTTSVDSEFSVTNGKVTLQCYVQYIDYISLQQIGPPYITSYKIPANDYSSSGSNNRYGGAIQDVGTSLLSITTSTNANVNSQFEVSNMYPDSSYNFSVQAKNTNSGYGKLGTYNYSTPAPSYPSATFSTPSPSLLFNSSGKKYTNSFPYFFVGTTNKVTNDIINNNNISSGFVSNNIITAVQESGIYGKNSTNSSLKVTASLGSVSTNVNVTSFGTGSIFTNTSGEITITAKTFDAYFKGNNYNQGFYLDCSTNMTITSNYAFNTPTSTLFTAALFCSGNNVNNPNPSSNYSFYIDDINSNPIYTSIGSFTINSNSTSDYYSNQVSGIWVLNKSKNPFFSITNLKLDNMGDYFYASPLVNYTISNGVNGDILETNTNNVYNIINYKFENPIIITNSSLTGLVSNSYYTNIKLSIKFNNLYGQGFQNNIANINVICDQPSYNLITSILATSIQNLGTSESDYKKGYRVWSANVDSGVPNSGIMSPPGIVPYPYILSGTYLPNGSLAQSDTGYVSQQYSNVWNIATNTYANQELLVANGNFTTNNTYYKNYSLDFSGNGSLNSDYDYYGLSGKKYATFVWNVNSEQSNIYFQILFTNSLNNFQDYYYYDSNHTQKLELYYRFEYKTDVTTTRWGVIGITGRYYPNTTWISINSTETGNVGVPGNIICDSGNIKNVYWNQASISANNNLYTFKTPSPVLAINNDARLYLRIGMPNNVDNNFSSVNCYYSS